MKETFKNFLIIGGCHVNGYPFEKEEGFGYSAARHLDPNFNGKIETLMVTLDHVGKSVAACDKFLPDVLILQLGHFETVQPITPKFFLKRKLPKTEASSKTKGSAVDSPINGVKISLLWKIKNIAKFIVFMALFSRFYNSKETESKLQKFTSPFNGLPIKSIILLSPLPCADLVTSWKRKKLIVAYQKAAEAAGMVFVDAFSILEKNAQKKNVFWDSIHLNEHGHFILGKIVANAIEKIYRQSPLKTVIVH